MEKLTRKQKEKSVREEIILSTAQTLFANRGYNNVSMDEIAHKADFTKRTLYKYFNSKEDLYYKIALRGFKQMTAFFKLETEKGNSGFEKLKKSTYAIYTFYKNHPKSFHIITQIGQVKREDSQHFREWLEFNDQLFKSRQEMFKMGIEDGSIRPDIIPEMASYVSAFISTGFFNLFVQNGKTFLEHFNLDEEAFIKYAIDMMLDVIKAE